MGYLGVVVLAQATTVAFVLWPIFRIVRKAGYGRRYAWFLCIACAACSCAMSMLGYEAAVHGWRAGMTRTAPGDLVLIGAMQFALSPFTFLILPVIYFTFQKWPLEGRDKEADIFG